MTEQHRLCFQPPAVYTTDFKFHQLNRPKGASRLPHASVHKYDYRCLSAGLEIPTSLTSSHNTGWRTEASVLDINTTFIPVPKRGQGGYLVTHFLPFTLTPPPRQPSPPHAQQEVSDVGVHDWSVHWECLHGGAGEKSCNKEKGGGCSGVKTCLMRHGAVLLG